MAVGFGVFAEVTMKIIKAITAALLALFAALVAWYTIEYFNPYIDGTIRKR